MKIKVHDRTFIGNERDYLIEAIDQGEVSGRGKFVQRFEEAFAGWSGNKYAVAVCNGTAALQAAIWASCMEGTIAIPSGTIISCIVGAAHNGMFIRLYDRITIDKNLMRCHLFGKWNDSIGETIIDDCSQYWKPFQVKTVACYSLYANKLITSGEGGMVVTNSEPIYKRAMSYRDLCHSEERFIHYDLGQNFRMSNLQAAVGLAQLEQINDFVEVKQRNRDLYKKYLPDKVQIEFDVEVPWMYLIKTEFKAAYMVDKLKGAGVDCRRFFYPLHCQETMEKGRIGKGVRADYPYSENMREYAFYLPSGLNLTEKEIKYVCETLRSILRQPVSK